MSELKRTELSVRQERAVLVGVMLPDSAADPRDPLGELASLAQTAGARVVQRVIQNRRSVDPGTYIGSGKTLEIAHLAAQTEADVILFDNDLSPGQIGALEKRINTEIGAKRGEGVKILDRSELILDIFATRARTHEARLQVELAQLQYTYPRLMRMWSHLERVGGGNASMGIGTRGPGEQQLEIDRRLVRKRIADLQAEIRKVQQRKSRLVQQRNRDHFTVCLVGYTNAGKSTLFNTLTAGGAYADDKLFATLDTRTRLWQPERGLEVLLSDTVGFVRDLPHHLVASFKATLEEATHADLLLHVLDVGHERAQQQYDSVSRVLKEIGAADQPQLLLLNKIDTEEGEVNAPTWTTLHPEAIPISAKSGRGLDRLTSAVAGALRGEQVEATLEASVTDGRLLAFIESHAQVQDRQYFDSRVRMKTRIAKRLLVDLMHNDGVEITTGAS